ncbi:Starch-binding associating with outer membrane [Mucilaginibacter mallensis]|uniref:Starch-binding associating with outer membrane n=1 Tax=Mucilaginibacter mallensis TaxID=652787 RepID=A0A1H1RFW0_MUCMA|nr:RagB/SusD family nutrient uptake outer membrane protein [Mucilaginibacter mallensis]SDS33789.1 Starch-binding associating with outer membrane [Mucilaginibacter mallensis]
MKNKAIISIAVFFAGLFSFSCNKVLDKMNLAAISPSEVWASAANANAYLNGIYNTMMPGNTYGTGNGTDEGVAYQRTTNTWFSGTATFDSQNDFGQYNNIRTINILLANIDQATFDTNDKNAIKGQGLFWRAWAYYSLVNEYGGVPLILSPQPVTTDLTTLQLPRNTTTECVTQIVKDLDDAIALLPTSWSGNDYGRIDQGAAMAFKGRVLLFFASPLFNPNNDPTKWQAAYAATSAANTFCAAHGKALHPVYNTIWNSQPNEEDIMIHLFSYPQATYFQGGLIPLNWSKDAVGYDRPSLELVNAFPMKDGSAWDPTKMAYDTLFKNRDDRFYANIYYNGDPIQYLAGMKASNTYLWTYFDSVTNYDGPSGIEGAHNQVTTDPLWSNSSFYRMKAIDPTIVQGTVYNAAVDWPEIRYAEVLMNYGEAANEVGNTQVALNVLHQIRARAGILPGAGNNYGITATSQSAIRTAYQNERFVEFAFEGKRWNDLRRWKLFGYLRGLGQRHGLGIVLKSGQTDVNPLDDINVVWPKFTSTVIPTDVYNIAIKDQYYIYGIPLAVLNRNPKLQQNNNWGGTFDPLQ